MTKKDKPMAEAPKHARLSPSAAHRWLACPGSVKASGTAPDVPTVYAAEGTMLHHFTEPYVRFGTMPNLDSKHTFDGFDFTFNDEHRDCIMWCGERIRQLLREVDDVDREEYHEIRLNLAEIEPGMFGTSDYILYSPKLKTLYVNDYKFGAGVKVYAEGNEQLICYAIGAYDWISLFHEIRRVVFGVLQPRLEHYDVAELLVEDLEDWRRRLRAGAQLTHKSDAPLAAGDHCKFCPAKASCPALESKALAVAQEIFTDVEIKVEDLDGARIARILAQRGMVEGFFEAIAVEARRRLESGAGVPGFKLVQGRKSRDWSSDEAVKTWAKENKITPYDMKLLSPAQLEKVCKTAKVPFPQVLVVETYGNSSLVSASDPRPELLPAFDVVPVPLEDLF